jgi:hypothetical protein
MALSQAAEAMGDQSVVMSVRIDHFAAHRWQRTKECEVGVA